MKKTIRLTESELIRLIERVISEQEENKNKLPENPSGEYKIADFFVSKPAALVIDPKLSKYYLNNDRTLHGNDEKMVSLLTSDPNSKTYHRDFCNYMNSKEGPMLFPAITNDKLKYVSIPPVRYVCSQDQKYLVVDLNKPSLRADHAARIANNGYIDYRKEAPYLLG